MGGKDGREACEEVGVESGDFVSMELEKLFTGEGARVWRSAIEWKLGRGLGKDYDGLGGDAAR